MGWMRYPGRLAHLTTQAEPIEQEGRRIGTIWRTTCGRYLRLWFDVDGTRNYQASWVDGLELREEQPRGWCLKCAYWAALDALVLPRRDFSWFVRLVYAGQYDLRAAAGL